MLIIIFTIFKLVVAEAAKKYNKDHPHARAQLISVTNFHVERGSEEDIGPFTTYFFQATPMSVYLSAIIGKPHVMFKECT